MLFPVGQLIGQPDDLVTITSGTTIEQALRTMVENDFSQLPIVDEEGKLVGIITEEGIARSYYHLKGKVPLLELTVDHCQSPAVTLAPESDIREALDRLRNVYAIVITRDQKPLGILTDFDTTHFFRNLSEGLILIQDVEFTLRHHITAAFPEERAFLAALFQAFGSDKSDSSKPAKLYDEFDFGDHVQFIITKANWPKFEQYFKPRALFLELMGQVRQIRNQLAHFRGNLDQVQYDVLKQAVDWLATRPRLVLSERPLETEEISEDSRLDKEVEIEPVLAPSLVYTHLQQWFRKQTRIQDEITLGFHDIEKHLGAKLPVSAREHVSWWSNDGRTQPQSASWYGAGYDVEDVDLTSERVRFRRASRGLYQAFFGDVLHEFKTFRPGITRATRTYRESWFDFGAGRSGFWFMWRFTRETPCAFRTPPA